MSRRELPWQTCNFPLLLAPMVGLSNATLRQICQSYLPAELKVIWPTEMLSSRRLPYENLGATAETLQTPDERSGLQSLVPQILGNEEEPIRASIQKLQNWGATGIDINMGCPVAKALKHNYGVALMGDMQYAGNIVAMAKRSSALPVSVKLRAADQTKENYLLDFCKVLTDAGADWLTLHPRVPEQKRRGVADWSQIHMLKANTRVPVIGNGDIQTADDVLQMLSQTKCDYVMAGRGLAARPWMYAQVAQKMGFGFAARYIPEGPEAEAQEYGKVVQQYLALCVQNFGDELGLRKFRFYVKTTAVWLDYGHALFSLCMKITRAQELQGQLQEFFKAPLKMYEKTELRQ